MASYVKSEDLDDYFNEVTSINTDKIPVGINTNAGRGHVVTLAPLKNKSSPGDQGQGITRLPAGRAGVISSMKNSSNCKQPGSESDSTSEITRQLRQVTGAGFSNTLIEKQCVPHQSNEIPAQFEDAGTAGDEASEDISTLTKDFEDKSKLGGNVKSRGAKKRKGKDKCFQRYNPDSKTVEETSTMSEVDRSRLPKKTIAEIFRERPDYEKSYAAQQAGHGPFTLGSKNDFPAL